MSDCQRQSRSILGLAALLSLLLVQTAFSLPFRQTHINLSPRMLYHHLGSIVGAVQTGGRHIADDLELLYELRQLASGPDRRLGFNRLAISEQTNVDEICSEGINRRKYALR